MDSPQLAKVGRGEQFLRVLFVNKKRWNSRGYRLLVMFLPFQLPGRIVQ